VFSLKFKNLIIIFIIIIFIIILITGFLPVLLAGPQYAANFQYITLPLMLFMALLLIFMSVFFLLNYRLFTLLEREDWPALSYYLEQKIYVKGRYDSRKVRLLASSYMVVSDYASVLKLENKARAAKPSVIRKNVLIFGAARTLSGNHKDAAVFFKTYLDEGKSPDKPWIRWYYGFSLLLCGDFNLAEPEFMSFAVSSNDALITGLSAYLLSTSLAKHSQKPYECLEVVENGRNRVKNAVKNLKKWKNEADRIGNEIHITIIRRYIDDAGNWVFTKE
jgi:hypothetical protein